MNDIQLTFLPATRKDLKSVTPHELIDYWDGPREVIFEGEYGPTCLHYIEQLGVWLVSTWAGITGPSGRVGAAAFHLFPKIFLLKEEKKARSFARGAQPPYFEQSAADVLNEIMGR